MAPRRGGIRKASRPPQPQVGTKHQRSCCFKWGIPAAVFFVVGSVAAGLAFQALASSSDTLASAFVASASAAGAILRSSFEGHMRQIDLAARSLEVRRGGQLPRAIVKRTGATNDLATALSRRLAPPACALPRRPSRRRTTKRSFGTPFLPWLLVSRSLLPGHERNPLASAAGDTTSAAHAPTRCPLSPQTH